MKGEMRPPAILAPRRSVTLLCPKSLPACARSCLQRGPVPPSIIWFASGFPQSPPSRRSRPRDLQEEMARDDVPGSNTSRCRAGDDARSGTLREEWPRLRPPAGGRQPSGREPSAGGRAGPATGAVEASEQAWQERPGTAGRRQGSRGRARQGPRGRRAGRREAGRRGDGEAEGESVPSPGGAGGVRAGPTAAVLRD